MNRVLPFRISSDKPIPIFDRRGAQRTNSSDARLLDGAAGQDALSYAHNALLDKGIAEGDIDDVALLADIEVREVTEKFFQNFRARASGERESDTSLFRKKSKVILQKLGLTPKEFRLMARLVKELI